MESQRFFFFDRFLLAAWSHLGRILGCLELFLGGLLFQNHCKIQYKITISESVCFRYSGYLEQLLEAILAGFMMCWVPKWLEKSINSASKKDPDLANNFNQF
jgi:fructose-specific phosphotransferase system IIC component